MDVSLAVFEIDAFSSKIVCFPPHPCLTLHSGGTPCDINVIYIQLESTFNALQFRRCQYGRAHQLTLVTSAGKDCVQGRSADLPDTAR